MKDRIAIITGGSGGLGKSVSRVFLEAGARVVVPCVSEKDAQDLRAVLPAADTVVADMSREEGVERVIKDVVARLKNVHILVHLMGGFTGGPKLSETDSLDWDTMMNLNARSTFFCLKHVFEPMVRAKYGRIVTVGARPAIEGVAGLGPYAASKAAVITLTKTAALEGRAHGITANCVAPSTIDTPANRASMPKADFSAWVPPEHLAQVIRFFASEAGGDTSGALIPVFGRA